MNHNIITIELDQPEAARLLDLLARANETDLAERLAQAIEEDAHG